MKRRSLMLAVPLLLLGFTGAFGQTNKSDCMDCLQLQVKHVEPNRTWFESDGFCCDYPCPGYESYEMKQPDRGFGCLVKEVNNDLVVGDICDSNDNDLGCPEPDGGSGGGGSGGPVACFDLDNNGICDKDEGEPAEGSCGECGSPIVLDLGEQAYRLTSVADGVHFDLRNNGTSGQIAWTRLGVDNAFLALDRNRNGRIDTGAELFGNYTRLQSGALAAHGFEALREMDDNHDSILDARDAGWIMLLLWIDRNHDGVSSPAELQPIASSVVTALEIDPQVSGRKDQWGNQFRYMAHFRLAQGRRSYYDVFLRTAGQ
jgi:hypothetical protein